MPNGGSDCCGTCWFNRKNCGDRNWLRHTRNPEPHHCTIRDVAIDDPFYTFCANHPHRRPDRDPIPIGRITRHRRSDGGETRVIWRHSPDTEEIRLHLLELLDGLFEHTARDRYPIGHSLAKAIIWQLGQFKEQCAGPASNGSATTSTPASPITRAAPPDARAETSNTAIAIQL